MNPTLAFILLLVTTCALLLLPFVPGFIVLWRKQDALPLRVVRGDDVDARFFARSFRNHVRESLERRSLGTPSADVIPRRAAPGHENTDENDPHLNEQELREREVGRMLVSTADLRLPGDLIFKHELFAQQSVHGGDRNIYRAILADGDIVLGEESMLLRWMHADGGVQVGGGSLLHGRVTSDKVIRLESGCRFERLHAPRIEFGKPPVISRKTVDRTPLESRDIPHVADVTGRRWLIDQESTIPPGRLVDADLVFTGTVSVGAGTRIQGSIKGHKDILLGDGVHVTGSVVSVQDIHVGSGCVIHGPVLSEKSVNVGSGVMIGDAGSPTTISARNINIAPGAVAHGTVWARQNGAVEGASAS